MARGWESKAVEAQLEESAQISAVDRIRLSPEEQARERQREGLILSRKRILEQLNATSNPRYKKILRDSLADLDARIAAQR
jgi:hypothetical protein